MTGQSKKGTKRAMHTKGKASVKASAETLTFRPRKNEDDDYILQLSEDQLGAIHQQAFGEPFPRTEFRRYLESGASTTVVQKGSRKIGYYSYLLNQQGKLHITALVLDPKYQSDGVGTQVMEKLERDAKSGGAQTLEVYVQTANEKSIAFTRKLGFVQLYYVTPNTLCFQKRLDGQDPRAFLAPWEGNAYL